jgi:hypothetical protein
VAPAVKEVRAEEEVRAVTARATAVEEVTAPAAAPVVQESPVQTADAAATMAPVKQAVKSPPIRQIP